MVRSDAAQVKSEMVCQEERENLGYESFWNLPKRQLIRIAEKIVDMIQLWKVFVSVISVEGEQ